jgi:hypothetical protein
VPDAEIGIGEKGVLPRKRGGDFNTPRKGKDATMSYATRLLLILTSASIASEVRRQIEELWESQREALEEIVLKFVTAEITPTTMYDFETQLAERVRELARQLLQRVLNRLEAAEPQQMPHDVAHQGSGYRRLNQKTRNAHLSTLFGTIELWRWPYRYWQRDAAEACLFPLEIALGLVHGATPALVEAVGRWMAQAGATQQSVLDRLRSEHGVCWGAKRLRQVTEELSAAFEDLTPECQVARLLELLKKAEKSGGSRRPVLSVGRDGVTLREYRYRFFEYATVATVSVYDRAGGRLGTVYLARAPELGQAQMTERLTALIQEVLRRWEGPLPRLTYVTDAGDHETKYYDQVLANMAHPRTAEKLDWIRIVDYYHAAQRIWTMAEALFGKDQRAGHGWARRMCRLLKKPAGPFRVLHSAAALRKRRQVSKSRAAEFRKAYQYIRRRTKLMQYHEYQRLHLPIGSGVTEAACKTIVTQRLKLSGMRWTKHGAQTILNLRVVLLSGIWQRAYRKFLETHHTQQPRTYGPMSHNPIQQAA